MLPPSLLVLISQRGDLSLCLTARIDRAPPAICPYDRSRVRGQRARGRDQITPIIPPSLLVTLFKGWPGSVQTCAQPSHPHAARRQVWSLLRASTERRPQCNSSIDLVRGVGEHRDHASHLANSPSEGARSASKVLCAPTELARTSSQRVVWIYPSTARKILTRRATGTGDPASFPGEQRP
jgi:hypothetical protein